MVPLHPQDHRLHGPVRRGVRVLHAAQATPSAPVAGSHHASATTGLCSTSQSLFYILTISLHPPILHYNLVQVWLATLLSFVVVTVAYALLTRHSWSTDPSFAFVDSECSYNFCHHCC